MEQAINPWVLVGFNALLGIAGMFGAMWLRRMEDDMRALRNDQKTTTEAFNAQLAEKLGRDEFRDFRQELRQNFTEIFQRMDSVRDRLEKKADR